MILTTGTFASFILVASIFSEVALAAPTPSDLRGARIQKRSPPISFPIHRRSTTSQGAQKRDLASVTPAELRLKRDAAIAKINARYYPSASSFDKRAGLETIPMSSFEEDNLYYATVKIGTPVQVGICTPFRVNE